MICRWVKEYIAEGELGLEPKQHHGNPYAALHTSKNLSEIDQLRLTVAKLEIENERLKNANFARPKQASAVGSVSIRSDKNTIAKS